MCSLEVFSYSKMCVLAIILRTFFLVRLLAREPTGDVAFCPLLCSSGKEQNKLSYRSCYREYTCLVTGREVSRRMRIPGTVFLMSRIGLAHRILLAGSDES